MRLMEMRVATPPRVTYQGEPGAYGEMAVSQEWRGAATAVGAPTFADAIGLLGRGRADYAVIPVWNSTIGDIQDTSALLAHHASRLETVSELTVPVVHCLLALPGASLASIRYVGSHPTALAQCRRLFMSRQALQPCVAHDTAGAARELASLGRRIRLESARQAAAAWFTPYAPAESSSLAVIAGANVAKLYGLVVITEGVQDNPANATRFVVVKARDGWRW
jgi:prephenate dehydratase